MTPLTFIKRKDRELSALCEQYGVLRMFAFGSLVSGEFSEDTSDLDFIVELEQMPPLQKGENLLAFWTGLEDTYGRSVDLLTEDHIRNPYFRKEIDQTKVLIYDRESQEIPV
jgi:predicted nucleotidyltransferase